MTVNFEMGRQDHHGAGSAPRTLGNSWELRRDRSNVFEAALNPDMGKSFESFDCRQCNSIRSQGKHLPRIPVLTVFNAVATLDELKI